MRLQVPSLALLSGLRIQQCSPELASLALLWLWYRVAAVAPIGLLAWEPPYAVGLVLKSKKEKN